MNQEHAWSERFRSVGDDYLFGVAPNRFLAKRAALLRNGQMAVSIADGEGRNSVWLAEQGLAVTAIEISGVALEKARRLAAGRQVAVHFLQDDMLAPDWPPATLQDAFDWVVGIFIQFAGGEARERQLETLKRLTRQGGRVLLHGYTLKQLDYGTGGPKSADHLYTSELLRAAFADWEIEEIVEYEDDLEEGFAHRGRSALIGLVARKP